MTTLSECTYQPVNDVLAELVLAGNLGWRPSCSSFLYEGTDQDALAIVFTRFIHSIHSQSTTLSSSSTMAAVSYQQIPQTIGLGVPHSALPQIFSEAANAKHDDRRVKAALNYYQPNADGSPPHPTYVDRPETYERPVETHDVLIQDITGSEEQYRLDDQGFQVHAHSATEKAFVEDDQIKASYYPEVEQLLKDV